MVHLPLLPEDLAPPPGFCPDCQGGLETPKTLRRHTESVRASLTLRAPLLECPRHPEDPFSWTSPVLARVAPSGRTYDLKVALLAGLESLFLERTQWRTRHHLARDRRGPSAGTISLRREEFLLRAYALHRRSFPALRRHMEAQGGWVLHVDGTLTEGSPTVFVAWDEWSGHVLDSRVISTENEGEIAELFRDMDRAFGAPRGIVSDMGAGTLKAAGIVWPGVPHQLCHFHWVRDLGKDLFEALERELRLRLLATKVLAHLNQLEPGKEGDWKGSGRKAAQVLERELSVAEPRWMRILQDHLLSPREQASRFPFELTYGTVASRLWEMAPVVHELAMWNVGQKVLLVSLVKAEQLLTKVTRDPELTVLVRRLESLVGWFGELREALGVGRDVTGSDGVEGRLSAEEGRKKVEELLARIEAVVEKLDDEGLRQGVRQMREAWEKRKEHLFVEVRDREGNLRRIELTNWRSEQGHREIRLGIRGRTRQGRTEEEMTRHGALMAVVLNWRREGYPRATGWERLDIVQALGTVSEEELEEARKRKGRTSRRRSDVRVAAHREPMLREFLSLLKSGGPGLPGAIRGWMARREPLRQPAD